MIEGFDQREIPRRFDLTSRTGSPCSRLERRTVRENPLSEASRRGHMRPQERPAATRVASAWPSPGAYPSAIRRGPINSRTGTHADDSAIFQLSEGREIVG
jgi:hypothetical protein